MNHYESLLITMNHYESLWNWRGITTIPRQKKSRNGLRWDLFANRPRTTANFAKATFEALKAGRPEMQGLGSKNGDLTRQKKVI